MTPEQAARLADRIAQKSWTHPNGCQQWAGALSQSGGRGVFYPVLWVAGRVHRVARLVLILEGRKAFPPLPGEGLGAYLARATGYYAGREAAHTCDNARCVDGAHLTWRSHQANIAEQVERRRLSWLTRGARRGKAAA